MKGKIISIFSGIDCLGIGFSEFFDIILSVEKEKNACETLVYNKKYHGNSKVLNEDIENISDSYIKNFVGVCGIIGGPPCQPFSSAKDSYDPTDKRIKYLLEYIRWVRIISPKFFMFENVKGLLEKEKIGLFNYFKKLLNSLGYDVYSEVLNAHDYGSAQARKRVIVVGFKKELSIKFEFPKPIDDKYKKYVRDIIKDEPLGECVYYSEDREEIVSYVPQGGYWKHLPTEELIKRALQGNYTKRQGGMTGYYRRLAMDQPCLTLTTQPAQKRTMRCHPFENRPLSINEYKRAQGVPDDYTIIGSTRQKYEYIGNGVPVELSNIIAKSIFEELSSIELDEAK